MVEAKKARPKKAPKKKIPVKAGEPRKVGHPLMLDAERMEVLLNAIRLGTPLHRCCDFAGISRETLRQWRHRGEKALLIPPGKRNPTDRKFAEFIGALDKAIAQAIVQAQRTVHTLMTQDVVRATPEQQRIALTAAQFFLTHRAPEDYNTKTTAELTGKDGGAIEVALSAEKAWEILQAVNSGKPIDLPEEKTDGS